MNRFDSGGFIRPLIGGEIFAWLRKIIYRELQCNVICHFISYYSFIPLSEKHLLALRLTMQRKYDIVLLGATGFTGGLMVEYMTATFPASLRWAIAARNKIKLEQVAREFKVEAAGG